MAWGWQNFGVDWNSPTQDKAEAVARSAYEDRHGEGTWQYLDVASKQYVRAAFNPAWGGDDAQHAYDKAYEVAAAYPPGEIMSAAVGDNGTAPRPEDVEDGGSAVLLNRPGGPIAPEGTYEQRHPGQAAGLRRPDSAVPEAQSELYNERDRIQRSTNPYADNIYAQGGKIVSALTGRNELQQSQQRSGLVSQLIGKGLWGSGVMAGLQKNMNTRQDLQDSALDQDVAVKRAEWGALGRDWERYKLQQIAGINSALGTKDTEEQNRRLTQAGFFSGNQQYDETMKIKKDKAALAPYQGLGA